MDINYPRAAVSLKVRSDVKFHNAMHFYSSWLAPGLQSISAGNFIPIPLFRCGSLASLDITLHLGRNADRDGRNWMSGRWRRSFQYAPPLKHLHS